MSFHQVYWQVRDLLVQVGMLPRSTSSLVRHAPGTVRRHLYRRGAGAGHARYFRRVSLQRLLR